MSTAVAEYSGLCAESIDIEKTLMDLMRYGRPRLGVYGEGWHASIEMNTEVIGGAFDIRSEFKCASPSVALRQLVDRVEAAVRK